ncbi:MAG TPA: ArsR family transcriptional regulator [Caldilineaceae bacterium]|nr:ArsR family transcriptional regulator [Caldilineaceae bacterium]
MHTVRKHILQILKETEGATVAELADQLGMAPVSVRHHLDILQGDNLICIDRVVRKGSVGRPQQLYVLTDEASGYFPNNFAALAGNLARQLKQVLPPDQVQCAFRAMAHEIASELSNPLAGDEPLEERLAQITEFLNQRGYLAHWEPLSETPDDGYLLHKCNCPYAGVSTEHRELCLMDQTLVEELVGEPCRRTQAMVDNAHCCTYHIRPATSCEIRLVGD